MRAIGRRDVPGALAPEASACEACRGTGVGRKLCQADAGLPLEHDEVQRRCSPGEARQQGVNLSAMMGLVVEEMDQSRCQRLLEIGRIRNGAVAQQAVQPCLVQFRDVRLDPLILGSTLFIVAVQFVALGVVGDILAGSRVLQQRVLERVRRVELHLGVEPSHYEPGARSTGQEPTTGAQAGPATGKAANREEALR